MNYIKADLQRIIKKRTFLGAVVIFMLAFIGVFYIIYQPQLTGEEYISKMTNIVDLFPLVIGCIIFLGVYHDDFKCKSMQVAIGFGIKRYKIIVFKMMEQIILSLVISFFIMIITLLLPVVSGVSLPQTQQVQLVINILFKTIQTVGYISFASLIVFLNQNAILGAITFILLASNTIYMILGVILHQEFFVNTVGDLSGFLFTSILVKCISEIQMSVPDAIAHLLLSIIYIIIPMLITQVLFKNRELEF